MMLLMRTTVRIADDLLVQLRERASRENVSLTRLLDETLRKGLRQAAGRPRRRAAYREMTASLGEPRVDLSKGLALAATLEDEEIVRKLALRK